MAEFTYNPVQTVQPGQNVIFNDNIKCPNGYVLHRQESGLVILRGITKNPCNTFARYQVMFKGNVAIPDTGTVAPIAISLAIDGEPIQTSTAELSPTVVGDYNVAVSIGTITVPTGCCFTLAVENISEASEAVAAQAINVRNAVLDVSRIA